MSISFKQITVCLLFIIHHIDMAKILGVFPIPAISHQSVFRPVMEELAKRGHEVTVITTDPAYPKGQAPYNFTEIDTHDAAYAYWKKFLKEHGNFKNQIEVLTLSPILITSVFEEVLKCREVQKLINDKNAKFDLLIMEALVRPALVFSHLYRIPVISFGTFSGFWGIYDMMGAASHPLIYPEAIHTKIYNLTLWEKLTELHLRFTSNLLYEKNLPSENEMIKRQIGPNTPLLEELAKNIQMVFLNTFHIWDHNRPVPPNLVYLGGLHTKPHRELPQDLKTYLDSSKNGVIYVSFGTTVVTSMFPSDRLKIFTNVFSKLPYDILFKWEKDELPGRSDNVKIFKWLPQSDLLRHPKIKLFITQCGQQSTDEALMAGVPLIGIPIFGDQWFNAERYIKFNIGKKLVMDFISEESLSNAIETVIEDKRYHENIINLRKILFDQPQTSLERAVWWTEHLLRHGGATHLRAPAALMHWTEYYELKSVLLFSGTVLLSLGLAIAAISLVIFKFRNRNNKVKRN